LAGDVKSQRILADCNRFMARIMKTAADGAGLVINSSGG